MPVLFKYLQKLSIWGTFPFPPSFCFRTKALSLFSYIMKVQPDHEQKWTHLDRHHKKEQQITGGSYAPPLLQTNASCGYHQKPWFNEPLVTQFSFHPMLFAHETSQTCAATQSRIVRWGKMNHCFNASRFPRNASQWQQWVSNSETQLPDMSTVKCKPLPKAKYQVLLDLKAGLHITAAGQSSQLTWVYWLRHSSFEAEVTQKRRNTGSLGTEQDKEEAVMGEWSRRIQLSWSSDAAPTQGSALKRLGK